MAEGFTPPPARLMKQWTQIKGENAWTMFKVIAEFVDGFESLNRIGPCIYMEYAGKTNVQNPKNILLRLDSANRSKPSRAPLKPLVKVVASTPAAAI